MQQDHSFGEIRGRLDLSFRPPADFQDKVVLSSISHGEHVCTQAPGVGIKYVAKGTEYYTFEGRTHAVEAGQFLCVSQSLASQVEVKRTGSDTFGLCLFIRTSPSAAEADSLLLSPLIFSERCSTLGHMLAGTMKELLRPAAERPRIAASLLTDVRSGLDLLLSDTYREFSSLKHAKNGTRFESLRRLHRAQAYLHDVTHRSVELLEVAEVCGMSRFHLLRQFKECFGETPASYHRRLRLQLAKDDITRKRLSCGEAAYRYGFASASSFSHAYRRLHGDAPLRSRSL